MWKRHNPFYIAAMAGVAALVLAALVVGLRLAAVVGANVFFVIYLVLSAFKIHRLTPDYLKQNAARSDEPVGIIFAVTFGTVVVSVASMFALINSTGHPHWLDLTLTLAAVPLGWLTIHMMAAVHYAHLYWQPDETAEGQGDGRRHHTGGLDFPGDKEPGGIEFLYFAYIIGMTAQTSDTAITSSQMRRVNLVHAIISFFFNTVLVAAAVNVAVALGQAS